MNSAPPEPQSRKHAWPWFVLAGVVLGIVLAVYAVMLEVRRVKSMQHVAPPNSKPVTPASSPGQTP